MRGLWVLLALGWGGTGAAAVEGLRGRVEGGGRVPAVVQVFRVDAATGQRAYWGVGVPDEEGRFEVGVEVGLDQPERVELEAPPYLWQAIVRPGEAALLVLVQPERGPARLRGVPGGVRWEGEHPEAVLASVAAAQDRLLRELNYDLTVGSGAVAGGGALVAPERVDSIRGVYRELWEGAQEQLRGENFAAVWADHLWKLRADWIAVAESQPVAWAELEQRLAQRLAELGLAGVLQTEPVLETWRVARRSWWTRPEVDPDQLRASLRSSTWDSVAVAMGRPQEPQAALELCWWVQARQAGVESIAQALMLLPFSGPMVQVCDRMRNASMPGSPGYSVGDFQWTTPSGDWEHRRETADAPWTLLLVVRAGSSAADLERQIFESIRKRLDRKDLAFIVLSLDTHEADWMKTASRRQSSRETVRWIGADARLMEALGLVTVPQLVALDGNGRITPAIRALPSQGLEAQLQRALRPTAR